MTAEPKRNAAGGGAVDTSQFGAYQRDAGAAFGEGTLRNREPVTREPLSPPTLKSRLRPRRPAETCTDGMSHDAAGFLLPGMRQGYWTCSRCGATP